MYSGADRRYDGGRIKRATAAAEQIGPRLVRRDGPNSKRSVLLQPEKVWEMKNCKEMATEATSTNAMAKGTEIKNIDGKWHVPPECSALGKETSQKFAKPSNPRYQGR